jgi:hypothetical protein
MKPGAFRYTEEEEQHTQRDPGQNICPGEATRPQCDGDRRGPQPYVGTRVAPADATWLLVPETTTIQLSPSPSKIDRNPDSKARIETSAQPPTDGRTGEEDQSGTDLDEWKEPRDRADQ